MQDDNKDTLKAFQSTRNTKKSLKKTTKHKSNYNCSKCKDTGLVKNKNNSNIKCSCSVKAELQLWLDNRLKNASRKLKKISYNLTNKSLDDKNLLFRGTTVKMFLQQVSKHLVEQYFRRGMTTFNYRLMTGNDYTEKYVTGEQSVFHQTSELYIILGTDNYNKTLLTTIYSLIVDRDLQGKKTWIHTPDLKTNSLAISDLYGKQVLEYVLDEGNFDKVIRRKVSNG